ncbi:hypothetical protein [Lactobacillus sp. Sy-1]|uniref:hypothetical protein n=1 Tax=Lactobacillus sp. Sy-1 TaxID=2109645 RepID=UPI001C5ABEDD|nr:hypothetical protein [Lactobacillus sp. Sy-1]MBW1606318.1 hypothetical protein [Lactobacillus sp. Sy-1]
MSSYLIFTFKKIFNNKMNVFLFLLIPFFSILLLFVNLNAQKSDNMYYYAQEAIKFNKDTIHQSNEGKLQQSTGNNAKKMLTMNSNIQSSIDQGNWYAAYNAQKKYNNYLTNGPDDMPSSFKQIEKRNNLLMNYLTRHRITDPESENYPTHNLTFTNWINNVLMPISISILMIFVLGRLFTSKFYGSINKSKLIPINSNKESILEIIIGGIGFSLYYLIVNLFNFIISSVIVGATRLDYPFFTNVNGIMKYVPTISIFGKALFLQVLIIFFMTSFIYLISLICKKTLSTIITSIALIIILSASTHIFNFLKAIAEFLPTTYIDNIGIISGNSLHLSNRIGLTDGVIVLLISILVIIGFIFTVNKSTELKEHK